MTTVSMKTVIAAPAESVWKTISDFNNLGAFVAAVADSRLEGSGVGCRRILTLQDGAELIEKLESLDPAARTLEYSIVSGPLPVDNYRSTMEVKESGPESCEFCWSSSFVPKGVGEAEARETIEGIYNMGFDGLKQLFS